MLKLAEELGLNNPQPGNETYTLVSQTENDIVASLKQELVRFKLVPKLIEEKLAILYQTPKFHKDPPNFRCIAGNISL